MRHHIRRRDQLPAPHASTARPPEPAAPAEPASRDVDEPAPRTPFLVTCLANYMAGALIGMSIADWRAPSQPPSPDTAENAPHPWLAFLGDDLDECDAPAAAAATAAAAAVTAAATPRRDEADSSRASVIQVAAMD